MKLNNFSFIVQPKIDFNLGYDIIQIKGGFCLVDLILNEVHIRNIVKNLNEKYLMNLMYLLNFEHFL